MYLLPQLNLKLRPTILNLKPGTRVVSHSFHMGEWIADRILEKDGRTAFLWIVPSKVEGTWIWQAETGPAELKFIQNFQNIEGTLKVNGKELPVENTKLEGDSIHFSAGDQDISAA